MTDDDDDYVIDARGNLVLIGLSAEETDEFVRLDPVIGERTVPLQTSISEPYRPPRPRWLELYEKHDTARRPFLTGSKTRH
jgi:hypothetical protein